MKVFRAFTALGALGLAACSTTPYQKPVAALAATVPVLKTAQATYSDSAKIAADLAHERDIDNAFLVAKPLVINRSCVDVAKTAQEAAVADVAIGKDLEEFYAPAGLMAAPSALGAFVGFGFSGAGPTMSAAHAGGAAMRPAGA